MLQLKQKTLITLRVLHQADIRYNLNTQLNLVRALILLPKQQRQLLLVVAAVEEAIIIHLLQLILVILIKAQAKHSAHMVTLRAQLTQPMAKLVAYSVSKSNLSEQANKTSTHRLRAHLMHKDQF
jgi:hypothetical protein